MIKYKNGSLGYFLLTHDNHYSDNLEEEIVEVNTNKLPSISIVIPYYNAVETIRYVLSFLRKAIDFTLLTSNELEYEVIIIDDSSTVPLVEILDKQELEWLKILKLERNKGRQFVRNLGIKAASKELLMFIDADVLVSKTLIIDHLKTQQLVKIKNKSAICFSLFNFVGLGEDLFVKGEMFEKVNDFRKHCVYQRSWIGCNEDMKFVGNQYRILETTNNLRLWPKDGWLGPWILANMVLGGLFTVNRKYALEVGGCSDMFEFYGFEETSLCTKLIVVYDSYVIPVTTSNAIHLEVKNPLMSRKTKNKFFRKSHGVFFNKFLKQRYEKV